MEPVESPAFLKALTEVAANVLEQAEVPIHPLPFRVGREDRKRSVLFPKTDDRRNVSEMPNNDLYLPGSFVSREHFQITFEESNFYLVDSESLTGTYVEGKRIGGERRGGKIQLHDGDVIMLDTHEHGYIFKFLASARRAAPSVQADNTDLAGEIRELRQQIESLMNMFAWQFGPFDQPRQ